ncbi:MAG: GNAT family N-acetyltransferase [Mucilaginibacter sp.]|nr:GNAT family N-acetyltransferase [Mucilaginibacter sp.]
MQNISLKHLPTINTPNITLRPINTNDAEQLYLLRRSPEITRYVDRPLMESVEDAVKLINLILELQQRNEAAMWAITLPGNDDMIGNIGFWEVRPEHYRSEIGYMLSPHYQGKGIMRAAIKEIVKVGFKTLGFHSIAANVNPDNQASIKLLKNAGFVPEAYFKENYYFNGEFLDSIVFSILNNNG